MSKEYYLGLDIGIDSVSYTVTDLKYNILKFHGEPAWGVHLFEEAHLSDERHGFRTARRKLDRRQMRVDLVQELFAEAIAAVDPHFFIRQEESALFPEDKSGKNSLFDDAEYTDRDYHAQYPTIHHLLLDLMTSTEPHDVRLVCLACEWLVAHRGHFLNEISIANIAQITNFDVVYNSLTAYFTDNGYDIPWDGCDTTAFGDVIRKKTSLSAKTKQLNAVCFGSRKPSKEATEAFPYNCEVLLKCLCGHTIKVKDLFPLSDGYDKIPDFSLGADDETFAGIIGAIGDNAELVVRMKAIYDWGILVDILDGKTSISAAKVEVYEQHKRDLAFLKHIIRRYVPTRYAEVFRDAHAANYVAYSYHGEITEIKCKATQKSFCNYIQEVLKGVIPDEEDNEAFSTMKVRLELGTFMPKQKDADNSVIPYQLYLYELDLILKNAETYLPFLSKKDDSGLSVSEKIRSIFEFRVPYFVGPLNAHSPFAWIERKADKIRPWNFEEIVDLDRSEQEFVRRMLNHCMYLPNEKVLPKESLLYQRFMVLNEINSLQVNGTPISPEAKQGIYNEVFMRYRHVSVKKIRDYLLSAGFMTADDTLTGINQTIAADLKTHHDFQRLLKSGKLNEEQVEQIVAHRTYTADRAQFRNWLNRNFSSIGDEDIRYISRLSYKGWGKLSLRFLNGIESVIDQTSEEKLTIIDALWSTNLNLGQLMSDDYDFGNIVSKVQAEYYAQHPTSTEEWLDDMYIPNAVKRPIIRAMTIVREIIKAFGSAPQKVFISMTRGILPEQTGKRVLSRKEQIIRLYEKCAIPDVQLLKKQLASMGDAADSLLQSDKLFLYFIQLGKCIYTGRKIDIEGLSQGNTGEFNIEHIYPQSLVKDDSIIYNEVLVNSKVNEEKSDIYPVSATIRAEMTPFWKELKEAGLMSGEKFHRLTRSTEFTDKERLSFIDRQLADTSSAAKAVTALLDKICPDAKVVHVKTCLTSEFRSEFGFIKSRLFNDLYRAKDAYLNIICGNVYSMRFARKWFRSNEPYSVKASALYSHPLICGGETIWDGSSMLEIVKRNMRKNNIHMTRYAIYRGGSFFDHMPLKSAEGLAPRKAGMDTEKYGGYNRLTISHFMLARYMVGTKSDAMFVPVELLHSAAVLGSEDAAQEYAKVQIGKIIGKTVDSADFPLGRRPLKIGTIISFDGLRTYLASKSSGGKKIVFPVFTPFVADADTELYLKRLQTLNEKVSANEHYVLNESFDKVTLEDNIRLYELYEQKLKESVYANRFLAPTKTLIIGKSLFISLPLIEQVTVLLNIHSIFNRSSCGGCDLTKIGGAPHAGAAQAANKLSVWKKRFSDVRIIDQSASGLWEKQSENILGLL